MIPELKKQLDTILKTDLTKDTGMTNPDQQTIKDEKNNLSEGY
jgi:hypothetical protein